MSESVRAQAEVYAAAHVGPGRQQGHVFARVVGAGNGRVAPVVGGEDREIVRPQRAFELRQPGIELFERAAVAFDIVAMPVLLVEIDQVHEDQTLVGSSCIASRVFAMPSALFLVLSVSPNAASQEHVEDLADAVDRDAAVFQLVEQHASWAAARRNRGDWRCA